MQRRFKSIEELKNRKAYFEGFEKEMETSGHSEISTADPYAKLINSNNPTISVAYIMQISLDQMRKLIQTVVGLRHFLTWNYEIVSTETTLNNTSYEVKRIVYIFGVEQMVRRLQERKNRC